ncbi:MAG: DUF3160 domain-containing protein [Desulfobacteraceae bacterium]|nr:DUF3160 domain-containing protein [Desulfobacteraceae bacterium]
MGKKSSAKKIPIILSVLLIILFSGPVSGNDYLFGDADGNGKVDIFDALLIARYDVNLETSDQIPGFAVADVNEDGIVDIFDTLKIAMYVAGKIPSLEKEKEPAALSRSSEEVFGYMAAFEEELEKIGQISPEQFAKQYKTSAEYIGQISWDPKNAEFWEIFNTDPREHNQGLEEPPYYDVPDEEPDEKKWRNHDFRLNDEELAIFDKNGFVVSERLQADSFGEMYYKIYVDDLPVFVSADSILHAWHRSFDAMLEDLEESYLNIVLNHILTKMSDEIPKAWEQYGNTVLAQGITDADYFLAVARSLLDGIQADTLLYQDARVAETLAAIENQKLQEFSLFGRSRNIDFSQFKVRGHYEHSDLLEKYFKAMMWCGRIDLRVAGNPDEASPQELGAAIIMHYLLQQADMYKQWEEFDQIIQTFVGKTDSMTFAQLGIILNAHNIQSPGDINDLQTLQNLQDAIMSTDYGAQDIQSHLYVSTPYGSDKVQVPRSFTLLGQKFILDSWVFSKVVADNISWDNNKVRRRIPTSLDVAFAVFGNSQIVPEIVSLIMNPTGVKFRDGLFYQHNLAALRNVIDKQNEEMWEENIYMNWLATLRELSEPTTDPEYPEAMRTRAWAMKTLNTQLGSWTQMRHDTVLYAKQSISYPGCLYPAGYVEPRPEFWARFEKMTELAASQIESIPFPEEGIEVEIEDEWGGQYLYYINPQDTQKQQVNFLKNFKEKLSVLRGIAEKELAQETLSSEETTFLQNLIEIQLNYVGEKTYSGWYPGLFYKERKDSERPDPIVTDVHTDYPSLGDPGCILHEGVGNVFLLMIAADNGDDQMVFAGPVMSHYEFTEPIDSRKSDSEWSSEARPPHNEWTKSYLVPEK